MKKALPIASGCALIIIAGLVLYAFMNTWGKTELEIRIHINEKLVQESSFGESPTFAIWLESPESGETRTIYVTRRAAEGDWEGKAEVPVALPEWFEIQKIKARSDTYKGDVDGYSGATPKPGYFIVRSNLVPGSKWKCLIEVNLAGDFNEYYQGNRIEDNDSDKYLSGQPAILYNSEITAIPGAKAVVSVTGMTIAGSADGIIVHPLKGITSATGIFDEIKISVIKPKPRIIKKKMH